MAISKRKNKDGRYSYQVRVFDNYEVIDTKTFCKKALAEEYEAKASTKVHENRARGIKDCYFTFTEFWNQVYLPTARHRLGAHTIKSYRFLFYKYIEPPLGSKIMAKTTSQDMIQLLSSMKKDPVYVNKVRQVLAILFNLGMKLQHFTYNPLSAVPQFKEKTDRGDFKWWQQNDIKKFLDWCRESNCPRYLLYKMVLEEGGMRPQEVMALKRDQVNIEIGWYRVCRSYNQASRKVIDDTKTNNARVVRLSEKFCQLLKQHLETHDSDYLFPNFKGTHYHYENLKAWFKKDCMKAGVRYIGLNGMRHSFASHFMMTTKDKIALTRYLGHVSDEMLQRYVHLSEDYMAQYRGALSFEDTAKNVVPFPQNLVSGQ